MIERCLSASITAYSALGMVKLSRISLSFFALCGAAVFSGFAAPTALKSGAVATVFGGGIALTVTFLTAILFTKAFLTGADSLAAFWVGSLARFAGIAGIALGISGAAVAGVGPDRGVTADADLEGRCVAVLMAVILII